MDDTGDARVALLVIDVQQGFDDADYWGRRDNQGCETNIAALIDAWKLAKQPIVFVLHGSDEAGSPLRPGQPGHELKPFVEGPPDLQVVKSVNSAFLGEPALEPWLNDSAINRIVICGITTNHCCETTARMGANLGFDVVFALDATHTFDRDDLDGRRIPAEELARVTAANLQEEFAEVMSTEAIVQEISGPGLQSPQPG